MKIAVQSLLLLPFLIWSFTLTPKTEPGDIKVSIVGEDVKVEWTGFSGISYYVIEVATEADATGQLSFTKLAEVVNDADHFRYTYIDKSAGKEGLRYYRIKHLQSETKYILSDVKTANFLYKENFTINLEPDYNHQAIYLEVNSKSTGDAAVKLTGLNTTVLFEKELHIKKGYNQVKLTVPQKLNEGISLFSFSYRGDTQHVMLRKNPVQNFMVVSEE